MPTKSKHGPMWSGDATGAQTQASWLLTGIVESSEDAIVSKDLNGIITSWNASAERLFGYSAGEAIGQPVTLIVPKDRLEEENSIIAKIRRGERLKHFETVRRRKDGMEIPISLTISPIRDAAGDIIGASKIARDISQPKAMEEALRQSEERIRLILENVKDFAIFTIDLEGRVASWNPGAERLFGYTEAEVLHQPVSLLYTPEDREARVPERERQRAIQLGCANDERWQQRKDGSRRFVTGTVRTVRDAQGRLVALAKVARDISERKKAQDEVEQLNRSLEKKVQERTARLRETVAELEGFSYSIAHDMRAPLRGMQGFAALLQEEMGDQLNDLAKDYLRRITSSANRLDALIQDVLNYSKVVRADLTLQPLDPGKLIQEIVESYSNLQPPQADIQVEQPMPMVMANPAALTQVISNLLGNAVKFFDKGTKPRVRVRAETFTSPSLESQEAAPPQGDDDLRASVAPTLLHPDEPDQTPEPPRGEGEWVRLWFEDNGIGIPKAAHQRIFQMFQRLHPSGGYEGTGIGLTIVRKAVERMGGRVGVESDPGEGSRFWIELRPTERNP